MDKPDKLQIYCQDHVYYLANRPPTSKCPACEFLYRLRVGDISISGIAVVQAS